MLITFSIVDNVIKMITLMIIILKMIIRVEEIKLFPPENSSNGVNKGCQPAMISDSVSLSMFF